MSPTLILAKGFSRINFFIASAMTVLVIVAYAMIQVYNKLDQE